LKAIIIADEFKPVLWRWFDVLDD